MKFRFVFLGLVGLTLAGCSDDPVSPNPSGTVSFTYTGAGSANATTYTANGSMPGGADFGSSAWAAGGIDETNNMVAVVAAVPKTSAAWDMITVGINRTSVGSSTISADCGLEEDGCTGLFVMFGQSTSTFSFTFECFLTTGTVAITTLSSSNVAGTFSGTGTCVTPAGIESTFTVTNGTFSVPLIADAFDDEAQ